MMQSRTHTCGELRLADCGKTVTLCGWMENVRVVGSNFAFVVLRDFYGTTQVVVETEDMMNVCQVHQQGVDHLRDRHGARARQQKPQAGDRRRGGRARKDRCARQVRPQ